MRNVVLKGKLKLVTGLHIGGGNASVHIGGVDSEVVKDAYGDPYIPGSSLKGKIRSLLEHSENIVKDGKVSDLKSAPNSLVPVAFGCPDQDSITRVLFRDCPLSAESQKLLRIQKLLPIEEKAENSINRITGKAENPRIIERVLPGLSFDVEIIIRMLDTDSEEAFKELLSKGIALLERDALGGSGSRGYGKVVFEDLTWDGKSFTVESLK